MNRRRRQPPNALFAQEQIWIAKTVLLEAEWVLPRFYRFDRQAVQNAFTMLLGLPNVRVKDEAILAAAVAWVKQGTHFAGALHLKSRPDGTKFMSFDATLIRHAGVLASATCSF